MDRLTIEELNALTRDHRELTRAARQRQGGRRR